MANLRMQTRQNQRMLQYGHATHGMRRGTQVTLKSHLNDAQIHGVDRKEVHLMMGVPVWAEGAEHGQAVNHGWHLAGDNASADIILQLPDLSNHLLLGFRGWSWRAFEAAIGTQPLVRGIARRAAGRVEQDFDAGFVVSLSNGAAPIRAEQQLHVLRCVFASVY